MNAKLRESASVLGRRFTIASAILILVLGGIAFQVLQSQTKIRQFVVVGITVLGMLALLIVGFRYSRSINRPISALRATMTRHREGDLSASAREDQGSAEVRSLAVDFNALADANRASRLRIDDLRERLAKLINLNNFLNENLSLSELLVRILESGRDLIGASYGAIGLFGPSGEGLTNFATIGFGPQELLIIGDANEKLKPLSPEFGDSKILRLEHVFDHPISAWISPNLPPVDSYLGVPIKINEEIIGRFSLCNSFAGSFSAEDEQIAGALSLLAAVAIKNVQRIEAERERANTLERVKEIEHSIHGKSVSDSRLEVMCASLGKGLDVDRVIVRIVDGRGDFQLTAQWQRSGLQPVGQLLVETFPFVGDLAEVLWRSASIQIVDDLLPAQGSVDERTLSFHQITGTRAAIFAPIGIGERVIGLMYVLMVDGPRHWTEPESEVLKQIATYVATTVVADEHHEYLRKHIEQLQNLERQKSNFLATVSHELRTPLTSISGFLEILKEGYVGTINDEQKRMLEVIERNSKRLQALIENLLVIDRYVVGEVGTDSIGLVIGELIRATCEEYIPLAHSRGITLEVESGPDTAVVVGDRGQLQSVFANVVSNAIKFSRPAGVVNIECTVDLAAQTVQVICKDQGIGIPIEDQSNLFTRFFRASNAIEKHIPGTGLGLSIVQQIVHQHGGHIQLISAEGEGTTIVIVLPLAAKE